MTPQLLQTQRTLSPFESESPAYLLLEDGRRFEGSFFGWEASCFGEVVFNTAMTGYQEVLTDPSYAGQLVCMTYPLIGNYGVNPQDSESPVPQVAGFIVRESARRASSWRASSDLPGYLEAHRITGITGVARRDRPRHSRRGGLSPGGPRSTGDGGAESGVRCLYS